MTKKRVAYTKKAMKSCMKYAKKHSVRETDPPIVEDEAYIVGLIDEIRRFMMEKYPDLHDLEGFLLDFETRLRGKINIPKQ